MINKLWDRVSGKKSIRVAILWRFVISIIILFMFFSLYEFFTQILPLKGKGFLVVLDPIIFFSGLMIIFFTMTRPIVRYVLQMAEGLKTISQGDLNYRVPVLREDELGTVAQRINEMAEALLQQQNKERELEKSKMDLITGISHDLRTPLTSIIGYLGLIRNKSYQNEEEHERFVQNTYKKATQLQSLVEDLFEYTRLTSHDVTVNKLPMDVREMLEQLLTEFEPIAEEYQVEICWSLGSHPEYIVADPEKIIRALDNLLINALKFSRRPGVIQTTLHVEPSNVLITIENDGPPLTIEQEQHIFDRFYKADHARSMNAIQSGSGLGLSIARNIALLHSGDITLRHNEGHFAFTIQLPRAQISDASVFVV
ncbi:sensor histidine kinase [Paenibacillus sp. GCM10027629]|uniref:sensor histidine kinase n=1 Tax=Paenibacillus sp. GCM10027629 TaxID=3273414 RepID=UPI003631871F